MFLPAEGNRAGVLYFSVFTILYVYVCIKCNYIKCINMYNPVDLHMQVGICYDRDLLHYHGAGGCGGGATRFMLTCTRSWCYARDYPETHDIPKCLWQNQIRITKQWKYWGMLRRKKNIGRKSPSGMSFVDWSSCLVTAMKQLYRIFGNCGAKRNTSSLLGNLVLWVALRILSHAPNIFIFSERTLKLTTPCFFTVTWERPTSGRL